MNAEKIGVFISSLRKEKGLTQTELAEKLNISNRTVSKWENGDGFPDITILPVLAEILGVSVDELLSGEKTDIEEEPVKFEAVYTEQKTYGRKALKLYYESITKQGNPHLVIFTMGLLLFVIAKTNAFRIDFEIINKIYGYIGIAFMVLAVITMLLPAYTASSHLRRVKMKFGGIPQSRCIFSDKIYLEDGEDARGRMYYLYEDITRFIIGEDMYAIVFNKKVCLYFPKNSIKAEEKNDFESFISSYAKDIYNEATRKKQKKLVKVLYIVLSAVLIVLLVFNYYATNPKFFYTDLYDKRQYYFDNKAEFSRGLKNVKNDEDIQTELKAEGSAAYYSDKYITLDNIGDVDITTESVCFDSYDGATKYYSGYVYYEGEGIPTPKDMNFSEDEIDKETPNYIKDENIYLIGKDKNGTLTKNDWFLAMPLENNWYYCEYH
ncbi:MAG: helix-turn-helix domain-containing protein [Eubacterium sp.]|nr:helix-turn-helix domain-containing protein [Eubacterium sp.]